jgi:hypothetical protein
LARRDRLGADVVLADPGKPVVGERRDAGLRNVSEADVARLGQQHRADADVQVLGAGAAFAEMSERVGESTPAADLQEHFGERDTIGQHPGGGFTERGQLFGLIERFELCEVGAVGARDLGDLQREVVVEPLGRLTVGAVELTGEQLERPLRRGLEAHAGADLRPRHGPRGSLEQLRPRVDETAGAGNEHVPAVQRGLERLQHAERICAPVKLVVPELRIRENESSPPAGDDLQRYRCSTDAAGAALQRP